MGDSDNLSYLLPKTILLCLLIDCAKLLLNFSGNLHICYVSNLVLISLIIFHVIVLLAKFYDINI